MADLAALINILEVRGQLTPPVATLMATGLPDFMGARIMLPSNLKFTEWKGMIRMVEDACIVGCLKYSFPTCYEG